MASPTAPVRRGLALWIVAVLATSGVVVASHRSEPETTLVASGGPEANEVDRPASTTTTTSTIEPEPTTTTVPVTAPPTTVAPTATVPATTIPPTTTTTVPAAAFTISPDQPLSSSSGAHYMLAGTGCTGARIMLVVHGGRFVNEFYDTTTPLPDGTWGIGMMVAVPGTYEMRAACNDAAGTTLFDYAPVTFTILP